MSTLAIFAAMLSAIAAAVSAIMAWLTVRNARAARAEERRSVRPYFSFSNAKAWNQADGKHGIGVTLTNAGRHPACNVKGKILMIDCGLSQGPLLERPLLYPEVPPNTPVTWEEANLQFEFNLPDHYVYMRLEYDDPIRGEPYNQAWAWRWGGVSAGRASQLFMGVPQEELQRVQKAVGAK